MIEFIQVVGPPASGKSTWAQEYADKNEYAWISSDNIRKDYDYNIANSEVFRFMYERTKENLRRGIGVVYDATNLSMKRRKHLLDNLKACQFSDVIVYRCEVFVAPVNVLRERNSHRMGADCVSEGTIERMITQFQFPQYFEGWDVINVNRNSVGNPFDWGKMRGFDQHNPYHHLNLYDHSAAVTEMISNSTIAIPEMAGMWHDIGKLYTQSFDDKGIAHYYGHENVSAYIYLLNKVWAGDYYILMKNIFIINYHMRPMHWTPKAYEKDKELFGEEYTRLLIQFHYCDVNGGKE